MSHIIQQGVPGRSKYLPEIDCPSRVERVGDEPGLGELLQNLPRDAPRASY
jgi:hypothetical protein